MRKPRVRFAPSPTGFLHVGSARTFIFNWLYARHNGGTMILRLDDTDVERNTQASVDSIFEGLKWLGLGWDEEYKQSERVALHRKTAWAIFEKGLAYRDFTPAHTGDSEKSDAQGTWLFNPGRAGDFARRKRSPRRGGRTVCAALSRAARERADGALHRRGLRGASEIAAADIEDFALLRSDGMPTYHLASCADDADLRISHIIRGQDHLTEHFQACADFRSRRLHAAAVRASSAAGCARRNQAFETPAWAGGERHDLSRRRISARSFHQFSVPAGLVAEK